MTRPNAARRTVRRAEARGVRVRADSAPGCEGRLNDCAHGLGAHVPRIRREIARAA